MRAGWRRWRKDAGRGSHLFGELPLVLVEESGPAPAALAGLSRDVRVFEQHLHRAAGNDSVPRRASAAENLFRDDKAALGVEAIIALELRTYVGSCTMSLAAAGGRSHILDLVLAQRGSVHAGRVCLG
jgi:hypothetical protein